MNITKSEYSFEGSTRLLIVSQSIAIGALQQIATKMTQTIFNINSFRLISHINNFHMKVKLYLTNFK